VRVTSTSTSNAIEIQGLAKSFGQQAALAGASLFLRQGEVLGLLGPNGAGKTTLVRAIMGRIVPEAGTITVFGQPGVPGNSAVLAQVGWVTQELALYPLLSTRENLLAFGRYQGLPAAGLKAAVEKSLAWAALGDRAEDPVKTLSGGMKRRLNMAAGVIHHPRILLLDEPTVGVDPQSRERIYAMIEELRREGVSIVYTTHYMEEAERLCDRVAIIDHGRVIAQGTRDELVSSLLGRGREAVIECAALTGELRGRLLARGASLDSKTVHVPVADAGGDLMAVLEEFRQHGVAIENLALKTPSLESVFLHLTGRELRE
jgi:ABC-2 type transport system ATP-binding protein